jgi:hypothetical protein
MCPTQRFTAVPNGQQRSTVGAADLLPCPMAGWATLLPKLAVLLPGRAWAAKHRGGGQPQTPTVPTLPLDWPADWQRDRMALP